MSLCHQNHTIFKCLESQNRTITNFSSIKTKLNKVSRAAKLDYTNISLPSKPYHLSISRILKPNCDNALEQQTQTKLMSLKYQNHTIYTSFECPDQYQHYIWGIAESTHQSPIKDLGDLVLAPETSCSYYVWGIAESTHQSLIKDKRDFV